MYRWLLRLHPAGFRRQFADERLWIFDESSGVAGAAPLLADAAASLARQWLLRSGSWKVALALAGALFQVTIGGLGQLLFGSLMRSRQTSPAAMFPAELSQLVVMAVWTVAGLMVVVILLTFWVKKFTRRRIRALG